MDAPGQHLTKRTRLDSLVKSAEQIRDRWVTNHWRDIRDFCLPHHGQFVMSERTNPVRNTSKIIDGVATRGLRTFGNGMLVGVVPASRPWFELGLQDTALEKYQPVALWLEAVRDLMLRAFRESNFYSTIQGQFLNLAAFGTTACGEYEDFRDGIRFYPYPIGSYALTQNAQRRVDTFCHRCSYTVRQVVQRFTLEMCSNSVRTMWQNGNTEEPVEVVQVIEPNPLADANKIGAQYKPWSSSYWEAGRTDKEWLLESGFDEFPILAPRYFTEGEDPYGQSPTMDILGDIKALQVMHRQKARAVEKMVDPPLMGPTSLKSQQISTAPSKINYIDVREGMQGLSPVYQLNFPVGEVRQDIQELRNSINNGLFADLFLMLQMNDRREITAEEIRARQEEKILALSPLMERLDDELLDPLIDRTFSILSRFGALPPPPEELQGRRLKVTYTSTMAQIQKSLALSSSERLIGFVTNIAAQTKSVTVLDAVNLDAVVSDYAVNLGVSPRLVRTPEEINAIRQQRAAAQAQQAEIEQAEMASKTLKNLSETQTAGDSVLAEMADADA